MFSFSPPAQELQQHLAAFMDKYIYPHEKVHYAQAKELGPGRVVVDTQPLPRNANGKIQEADLRARAARLALMAAAGGRAAR